jgi:hypothetical protein
MVWVSTLLFAGAVAGVVAIISVMWRGPSVPGDQQIADAPAQPLLPIGPVAHIGRARDCIWSGETKPPSVGDDLVAGRKLVLKAGLAEFVFHDGARAIVEGPAILEVSTRSSARLIRGKCALTAEGPSARGFTIDAPGMKYTDLGTEFGVLVAQNGEQEMHVFRGKVQAEQGREQGAAIAEKRANDKRAALIVSAHEAIRVAAADASGSQAKPIEHIVADEMRFVRAILEPFPIYSSGVGLDRGARDPHWEITQVSTDANFKPQPAVVVVPDHIYVGDNRDRGQWISSSQPVHDQPPGCRWTLRTHFDLTGFDPASARIEGQVSVDNYLVEVRVNGKSVRIPPGNRDDKLLERWLSLRIEEGFASGVNTLEIVIENGSGIEPIRPQPTATPMAACLELNGLAQRLPNLSVEKGAR